MAHVLIPLPSQDSDPTEVAISWQVLSQLGHRVSFATPDGQPAQCDPIMIHGRGLDPWGFLPGLNWLRVFGLLLRANRTARLAYEALLHDPAFVKPGTWAAAAVDQFDALLLPGGHRARGMRPYLESRHLQALVVAFFAADKPVAAICHGALLAARSTAANGRSVLFGRKTTALTWKLERSATMLAHIGRFWDRHYYRTYRDGPGQPSGYMSVQQEVSRALARADDFLDVPASDPHYRRRSAGIARDTFDDDRPAWVVRDHNFVSARWPGDAHTFARTFARLLDEQTKA